jgi:hypothetical protein
VEVKPQGLWNRLKNEIVERVAAPDRVPIGPLSVNFLLDSLIQTRPGNDMNICLVTFSTTLRFRINQLFLNLSALSLAGFTEVSPWNFERLQKEQFYQLHRNILDQKRGAGYWLWKPYIILQELKRLDDGDYVVYSDCGRHFVQSFSRRIDTLLARCSDNRGVLPGVYIPYWGANRTWTKRDCFVLTGCDQEEYWNPCQIQASFSVWQKNEFSLSFAEKWLRYCTDERILTDIPNTCGLPDFAGFKEHRHDQSVLTICAIEEGLRGLGDPLGNRPFCGDDKSIDSVLTELGAPPAKLNHRKALAAVVGCIWRVMMKRR